MRIDRQGGKKPEVNIVNGKKEIKCVAKSSFGMSIHRALFQEQKKQGQRNIFKSNRNCYDFDVNPDFGSTLPKLVIRSHVTHQQEEKPVSIQIDDKVLGKVSKIMTYIKSGKRPEPKKDLNNSKRFLSSHS